jgi:formimidoylglutamase
MHLANEAERLLIPVAAPSNWAPDRYDVSLRDVMVSWREAETAEIGLVGIPFDTAVIGRRGCRFGPESVRSALVFANAYNPGYDIDLATGFTWTDFGNIDVLVTEVPGTHARVETVVTEIYRTGTTPVVIGGDHSLAYPDIMGLVNLLGDGKKIGVINIDAHLDVRHSHHGEISSGTPFRRLLEQPGQPLRPQNFVELGINGWLNSKYYMDNIREMGVTVISAREVHRRDVDDVIAQALEIATAGVDALFVSFDIDAVDLSAAPGTCSPSPGGLTPYQALEMVWRFGQHPLCRGFDLLEVSPSLDQGGVTSMMAMSLIMNFMAATKVRNRNKDT